jgi:hypothetical protein
MHRLLCFPVNHGQNVDLDHVSKTGELLERFLCRAGQPLQLPGHDIHHVVAVALGTDAIHIPLPSARYRVEREQPLFGQRSKELDGEESPSLGSVDELVDIVEPEGARAISCILAPASRIASSVRMSA